MRTLFTLLLFGACFLPTSLNAQSCQSIIPEVVDLLPAPNMGGFIDMCPGDALTATASASFPENGTTYSQSVATSTFSWLLDGEIISTSAGLTLQPESAGGQILELEVADIMGCTASEVVGLLRVSQAPIVTFDASPEGLFCPNTLDTLEVIASVTANNLGQNLAVESDFELPRPISREIDSGIFQSSLIIDDAGDLTVSDIFNNFRVCIDIEHSNARLIEIYLDSPCFPSWQLHDELAPIDGLHLGEPIEDPFDPSPGIPYTYCFEFSAENPFPLSLIDTSLYDSPPAGSYEAPWDINAAIGDCPLNGEWTLSIFSLSGQMESGHIFNWRIEYMGTDGLIPLYNQGVVSASWDQDSPNYIGADGETLFANTASSDIFNFTTTDSVGCEFSAAYQSPVRDTNDPLCIACEALAVNAGDDQLFNCQLGYNILDPVDLPLEAGFFFQWTNLEGDLIAFPGNPTPVVFTNGSYVLSLSREDGCMLRDTVEIFLPSDPGLAIGTDTLTLSCLNNGYLLEPELLPSADEYSISWFGPDFEIVEGQDAIRIFSSGIYGVRAAPLGGSECPFEDRVVVYVDEPIAAVEITPTDCEGTGGAISLNPRPGFNILSYSWSNGQTGPSATNLEEGTYAVTLEMEDCELVEQYTVLKDPACFARIRGSVRFNPDCGFGPGVEGIMLHLLPDDSYTFTDFYGNYEFLGEGSNNYTIEYIEEDIWELSCPSTGVLSTGFTEAGQAANNLNFYVDRAEVSNLCVDGSSGPARPGFNQSFTVSVCNFGATTLPAILRLTHDEWQLPTAEFLSVVESYDEATRTGVINVSALEPDICYTYNIRLELSVDAPLEEIVELNVQVLPITNDAFPVNNTLKISQEVTASFDPNDKQNRTGAHPFGGSVGLDERTQRYQIRFQNTGTDTAFTVVVRDTLDAALDVTTIRPGLSSHDYELSFADNNVLIFTFPNILLPDSTADFQLSQGFVNYSIMLQPDQSLGDQFSNRAAIYFDFNEPVITNQVDNIIAQTVSVSNIGGQGLPLRLSPNPAGNWTRVEFESLAEYSTLKLFSLSGELILLDRIRGTGLLDHRIDLTALPAGQYLIELQSGGSKGVQTLLKQ